MFQHAFSFDLFSFFCLFPWHSHYVSLLCVYVYLCGGFYCHFSFKIYCTNIFAIKYFCMYWSKQTLECNITQNMIASPKTLCIHGIVINQNNDNNNKIYSHNCRIEIESLCVIQFDMIYLFVCSIYIFNLIGSELDAVAYMVFCSGFLFSISSTPHHILHCALTLLCLVFLLFHFDRIKVSTE